MKTFKELMEAPKKKKILSNPNIEKAKEAIVKRGGDVYFKGKKIGNVSQIMSPGVRGRFVKGEYIFYDNDGVEVTVGETKLDAITNYFVNEG